MLRFRNVFYTISKLFHCPAKVFSEQIVHKFAILCCESYTCILILLCLSIFRSGAISGLGMGLDLCVGLLYEHRFAMIIMKDICMHIRGVWMGSIEKMCGIMKVYDEG